MKQQVKITPKVLNQENDVIVQYSDGYIINKDTVLEVPNQYVAIAYVDGKMKFRQGPGEYPIYKINKDFLKSELKVAFIKKQAIPSLIWGFGNINVNNERLKEAYRVGANGQLQFKIVGVNDLLNSFSFAKDITSEMIKENVIPVIKNIGADVLAKYFANTSISVFEINSKLEEIREKLLDALVTDNAFKGLGLEIINLTLNPIHVPEEDLEIIRNRINN